MTIQLFEKGHLQHILRPVEMDILSSISDVLSFRPDEKKVVKSKGFNFDEGALSEIKLMVEEMN